VTAATIDTEGLTLAERIKWARSQAGLSQERLADLLGTSRRHVMRWEKGTKPGNTYVAKLADVLDQPEEFFRSGPGNGASESQ
jgi:transcriptional regulator with XRE-family HTH domain